MYEYNMFINNYYMLFKGDLKCSEFEIIKNRITAIINELINSESLVINDYEKIYDFVMFTLLKKYYASEIISGKYDLEIKNTIKYFNEKLKNELILNTNQDKNYIYNILNSIKLVFTDNINLKLLSDKIYDKLIEKKYNKEDILNGQCDHIILELLRSNTLNIEYKQDFLDYKKKIEYKVSKIFAHHKINIIRKNPGSIKYDMSYKYYDSPYYQMNVAFELSLKLYLSQIKLDELNSYELDTLLNDYITKNMIKINSTKKIKEKKEVLPQDELINTEQLNQKKSEVWEIIKNTTYLIISKLKKENNMHEESQNSKERIFNKLNELSYSSNKNVLSLGGK